MLKSCLAGIVAMWCLLAAALPARGAGWLWLTSEFAGEGNVYRFNLDTGMVDLEISPALPVGAMHWNNAATDGTHLYLGSPTTSFFGTYDIVTGAPDTAGTYSPARLYRVAFVKNEAVATLVVTLGSVGFPAGGLADGMGWVPPPHCEGDADGDGDVDFADITSVLTNWGGAGPDGDADDDGDVEFADITSVLTNWGSDCG